MGKKIFIMILLSRGLTLWAQGYGIALQVDSVAKISIELFCDQDGAKLLELPVALQLTDKNYLALLFGNGETLQNRYHVWLFSSPQNLKELINNNKTISSTKAFRSRHSHLDKFYHIPANNMRYIWDYEFDNGYEVVRRNPKPAFFKVDENTKEITLFLTLYVAKSTPKFSDLFFAQAKTVELNIKIHE